MLRPDYNWHADVLQKLQESVDRGDLAEAELRFSSGDIWGGAGSVSDVSFSDPSMDEQKCKLLWRLVTGFARGGITYPPASNMAAIYKGWIRQGVFKRFSAQ
jgi:hypothetical protein